jgi:hypothetical protein
MELSTPTLTGIQDNLKANARGLSANNLGALLGKTDDELKPHLDALVKEKKIKPSTPSKGGRVLFSAA